MTKRVRFIGDVEACGDIGGVDWPISAGPGRTPTIVRFPVGKWVEIDNDHVIEKMRGNQFFEVDDSEEEDEDKNPNVKPDSEENQLSDEEEHPGRHGSRRQRRT
jgi:hypothetical protein